MSAARGGKGGGKAGGGSGRPRPGTGGHGRKRLAGKGPTPPAWQRTGHPAQRRAKAADARAARAGTREGERETDRAGGVREPARRPSAARRPADGPEVVAGRNPVVEALRARVPATALYVATRIDTDDRVRAALTLAGDAGVTILEAGRPELDRLTDGAPHQGIALRVPAYSYAHPDDLALRARDRAEPALIVALDGVTDPRNLGAVIRSVDAFGGHGVVVPSRRSAGVSAGVWKASAGAVARVPVARATNLTRTLVGYRDAGLFVVGLDASGGTAIADLEVGADPLVIVAGAEGRGLSRLVRETCDLVVRIPIAERAESLNAGVAVGIALYEVGRSRQG